MYITANGITNISKQCFVNLLNANFMANLLRTLRDPVAGANVGKSKQVGHDRKPEIQAIGS